MLGKRDRWIDPVTVHADVDITAAVPVNGVPVDEFFRRLMLQRGQHVAPGGHRQPPTLQPAHRRLDTHADARIQFVGLILQPLGKKLRQLLQWLLQVLQRLRDEAHRFAVTYHRQLRGKRNLKSMLEEIEGVGATRRRELLRAFGSVEKIKEAGLEELAAVPGMNRRAARAVLDFFND